MGFRSDIVSVIAEKIGEKEDVVDSLIEVPTISYLGDYSFPCFKLSGKSDEDPVELAKELSKKIKADYIEKIEAKGAYVNFFLKNSIVAKNVITEVFEKGDEYGSSVEGNGKNIVIDFSSPNIAKPFGIGHLRSTVIGNSLYKILEHRGYNCVGVNHLGDWGTQFGKLIVAYKRWGDEKKLEKDPIKHLLNIYVKFHDAAELNPKLEDEARDEFKKLEGGDKACTEQWEIFKELSLKDFEKYYSELGIKFDVHTGESFYIDKTDDVIKQLKKKVKTEISEGALIVNLEKYNMPPFMLKKSDGASTYHTRDLAAAIYRLKKYKADRLLYVVGAPQKLHFSQLFTVLEMMGYPEENFKHVDFGHFLGMSTRKGSIIFLEEVLDKAIELAKKIISEKNPKLENKNEVARIVGIGAVVFADLGSDRVKDVVFDWEKILNFEGETAPYIQYTHVRCCSIIKKAKTDLKLDELNWNSVKEPEEVALLKHIMHFDGAVAQAAKQYKPSIIARYLLDLCSLFNSFYEKHKVIVNDENVMTIRLAIVDCVKSVLSYGLGLLGIRAPNEM
tara:strand:- start:2201 stop:3880 length:1680 start_codon:yes stop_codon:yes gene_type:complete